MKFDGAGHSIHEIDLPLDHRLPGGRQAVLEISHVALHRRIQRIDHRFTLHRTGDLDASILQIGRHAANRPAPIANVLGIGQKVGSHSPVEQCLFGGTGRQAGLQRRPELTDQTTGKRDGLLRQDALKPGFEPSENVGITNRRNRFRHVVFSDLVADRGAMSGTTTRPAWRGERSEKYTEHPRMPQRSNQPPLKTATQAIELTRVLAPASR